jgi:hypothetical protein
MTTYIDPTTELPQNLGEIYSDRNLRIVGQARINSSNPSQIDTSGVQILCTPLAGGAEGISTLADGTYTLGVGVSLWVKITRSGSVTVTPEIYAAGSQPKSRRDYVQVFYMVSSGLVIAMSSSLIKDTVYSTFGYAQKTWDAVVGVAGDPSITHTDLQTAITDVGIAAPSSGGWIFIKKMCLVTTTITTSATKPIKLHFQGYGTGLQASGSPGIGITFNTAGCQLVGLGQITGFTTGVNLNNQLNSRLEMAFSSNTANVNYGTLTAAQYEIKGSLGLAESSHITTSTTHGAIAKWNQNTSKRWEPVTSITVDDSGNMTSTNTINANAFFGAGAVPIGGMVTVMPTFNVNCWQPPATGVVKDGFMRADGGTVPAGCVIPVGTVLPNMITKYPRGNTTSGTTGGANTVTLAANQIPQLSSSFTSGNQSTDHTHTATTGGQSANHTHTATTGGQSVNHSHTITTGGISANHTHNFSTGYMNTNTQHDHGVQNVDGRSIGSDEADGTNFVRSWYSRVGADAYNKSAWNTTTTNINHLHSGSTGWVSADHSHSGTTSGFSADHTHSLGTSGYSADHSHSLTTSGMNVSHTHTTTVTLGAASPVAVNNEPAYVEVVWVIRVK